MAPVVPDGRIRRSRSVPLFARGHLMRGEFLKAPVVLHGQRGLHSMPLLAYGYTMPMSLLA